MNIVEKAFTTLYPDRDISRYNFSLKYSGRFSAYNANVKYTNGNYDFWLSKEWRKVNEDIKIGLIHHLLQKVFNTKKKSLNEDLYHTFLKNVHIAVPKTKIEPELKESFDRVNERYFIGTVEMPNLVFGQKSFSKLGSYEYGNDTISISSVFRNIEEENKVLLDSVMFHEILHKVHKFKTKNGRSMHHTRKFKFAEKQFQAADKIDEAMSKFLRRKKFRNFIGF